MNLFAIAAVSALALGLGACAHRGQDMHQMREGGMMQGGMMEGDQSRDCPHSPTAGSAGAHEHAEDAPADCPASAPPQ